MKRTAINRAQYFVVRKIAFLICFSCFLLPTIAQKTTVDFARYADGTVLKMDIYQPQVKTATPKPVVVFVFGGGFFSGRRDDPVSLPYFQFLNSKGYAVAAIDYRLGLKGQKKAPSIFNRKPLTNAISIAVEDTYAATNYLLEHAKELNIDTGRVILSGASAGAITVLQSEYEKLNSSEKAKVLPASFRYAGVIAFAGAIYSTEGTPDYKVPPSPTLFFHGDKDSVVPYNKISFLGIGMYGSKSIARNRKKYSSPYLFYTFEGVEHDVALYYSLEQYHQVIENFIQDYILNKKVLFEDVNIKDQIRKN